MDAKKSFRDILEKTEVLKTPRHRLATFGQTRIKYFFVSQIPNLLDRSRLREGLVVAESPKIVTPETFKKRFEGFGKESEEFGKWLSDKYGATFQGLQYKFRNEPHSSKIELTPLKGLADRVGHVLREEGSHQSAIIQGPDKTWHISLMKFIVDECMRSFSGNLRELDEHGYFDGPEKMEGSRRDEIERLLVQAGKDRALVPLLEKKLRQYGLFKEYEDKFFKIVSRDS